MKTLLSIIVLIALTGFYHRPEVDQPGLPDEGGKEIVRPDNGVPTVESSRTNSTLREPDTGGPDACEGPFGELQIRSRQSM